VLGLFRLDKAESTALDLPFVLMGFLHLLGPKYVPELGICRVGHHLDIHDDVTIIGFAWPGVSEVQECL